MSSFNERPFSHLVDLFIKDFRNISEACLHFDKSHHLFLGHNGQGKTNYLEAIAIACTLKPMQTLKNSDLIRFHEPEAKIHSAFSGYQKLDVALYQAGKKAYLNDNTIRNATQIAKFISLVSFIPAELTMITGSPSLRRRALDQAAVAFFIEHLAALKAYEKILLHRNRLLKEWPLDHSLLTSFTTLLIKEAANIIFYRQKALNLMQTIFIEKFAAITSLSATIEYFTHGQSPQSYTINDLMALLKLQHSHVEKMELKRKVTCFGPHLDEVEFMIKGIPAKGMASRGQGRSLVIAFKLAHMLVLHHVLGIKPVIVLDDVVSELDSITKFNLINTIKKFDTQVFFSATDKESFGLDNMADKIYTVVNGSTVRV